MISTRPGAKVGSQCDGGDKEEDSDRNSDPIAESTNVVGAKKPLIGICCVVHFLEEKKNNKKKKKKGLEIRKLEVWSAIAVAREMGYLGVVFSKVFFLKSQRLHERERTKLVEF